MTATPLPHLANPDEYPIRPGDQVANYRVRRLLGAGGMCAVFEGEHLRLNKRVAIKVLQTQLARKSDAVERFVREGQAASRIVHPNAVQVFDVGIESGLAYLVMEFLEGESLEQRLERRKILPPEETLDLLIPVLSAVGAAHEAGVIHRDLKPANIFVTEDVIAGQVVKLLDFGISKFVFEGDSGLTQTGSIFGTPQYMAPEQARGQKGLGPGVDIFSLGAVVYECMTGEKAFPGDSVLAVLHKVMLAQFVRPSAIRPELAGPIEDVILRSMAPSPEERFRSAEEFARALLPYASEDIRRRYERAFGGHNHQTIRPIKSNQTWVREALSSEDIAIQPSGQRSLNGGALGAVSSPAVNLGPSASGVVSARGSLEVQTNPMVAPAQVAPAATWVAPKAKRESLWVWIASGAIAIVLALGSWIWWSSKQTVAVDPSTLAQDFGQQNLGLPRTGEAEIPNQAGGLLAHPTQVPDPIQAAQPNQVAQPQAAEPTQVPQPTQPGTVQVEATPTAQENGPAVGSNAAAVESEISTRRRNTRGRGKNSPISREGAPVINNRVPQNSSSIPVLSNSAPNR